MSYARSTAAEAQAIAEALRGLGLEVWRDDELPAHRAYAEVIEERLRGSRAVVVLWSAEAVKSQWVRAEADVARKAGTLVQLSLDGSLPPLPFDQIQCADLGDWDGDLNASGWRKVVGSVDSLMAGGAPLADAGLDPGHAMSGGHAVSSHAMAPAWRARRRVPLVRLLLIAFAVVLTGLAILPFAVPGLFEQGSAMLRARNGGDRIPVPAARTAMIDDLAGRLAARATGDLEALDNGVPTPWSTSQLIVALGGAPAADRQPLLDFIGKSQQPGCFCWAEIPTNPGDGACVFISGWVLSAYADLGRPVSHDELTDLLKRQGADGWWPLFTDIGNDSYASTYATAWVVLGLVAQKEHGLIAPEDRHAVELAIGRAAAWLRSSRQAGSRWSSYPTRSASKISESISALVIHALHRAKASDLTAIDREWLARLPDQAIKASASERAYEVINGGPNVTRIDHFEQIVLPWMLAALGDAYASGDPSERARALVFLDHTLAEPTLPRADAESSWLRAELLYGLKSLRRHL